MNKYLKAMLVMSPLLLMSGCFPPGGGKALAQSAPSETVCYTETQTQFLEKVQDKISQVHLIEGEELAKFMESVNAYRAAAGGQQWRANVMLIGEILNGSLGIALFQDGCLVKDSIYAATKEDMAKMFESNKSLDILKRLNLLAGKDA